MSSLLRTTVWGASVIAMAAATGCSRSELQDFSPPPSAYVEPPAPPLTEETPRSTDLLGGPPSAPAGPDPGVRYEAPPPPFGVMAPIPNPEDMDPLERARVYGEPQVQASLAESRRDYSGAESRGEKLSLPPRAERPTALPAQGDRSATDIARPAGPVTGPKLAPPATKPAAPIVRQPAAPADAPEPSRTQTTAQRLGAALAPELASGAKLETPPALAQGEQGMVVLTMPQGFLGRVQEEAKKLGLGIAARAVDIRARLTGDGYVIVPSESQTARLQEDQQTSFSWQVTPGTGEKGPLTAQVEGELNGGVKPVPFPLPSVSETAFDDIVDRATPADAPLVTIPGVGPVRTGLVILIGLALLAIILLSAFGRRGRERRRAEQRQRARETRADFSPSADTAAAAPGERKAQATAADTGETETPNRKEPEPS